jgi:putative transposase
VATRTRQDQVLAVAVATIYAEHHGRYGSPRVQIELQERGQRSGRKRIARLMLAQALCARPKRRYRTTTDSRHGLPISPNLVRQLRIPTVTRQTRSGEQYEPAW